MKNFACDKCGSVDVFTRSKGSQTGLYCSDCCSWLKWVSKKELSIVEEYINRNKVENEKEDITQEIVDSIDNSLKDALEYNLRKFAIEKGFIVGYKGKAYFINNAIKSDCEGNRIYQLVENIPYDCNNKRLVIELKESEIYKVKCWSNFKRGIFNVYDFNMEYWHRINLKKMLNKYQEQSSTIK